MAKAEYTCSHCQKSFWRERGQANVSLNRGQSLKCSRRCVGLAKRLDKTRGQKRLEKAEYDRQYREKNRDRLKAEKAAYYQSRRDERKVQDAARRAAPGYKARHKAYLKVYNARPEWKAHKKAYDRKYRAVRMYGEELAPAAVVLWELQEEINGRITDTEIRRRLGTQCKSQVRRREWDRKNTSN